MKVVNAPIEKIKTGLVVRRVCGISMNAMMRTIDAHGLLQPVGLTSNYELVYGYRRFEACRRMGWDTIPAVFIEKEQHKYDAMNIENTMREDLTPEEQVLMAQRLEEEIRANHPALLRKLGIVADDPEESGECGSVGQVWQNFAKPDCKDKKKEEDVKNEPIGQVWENFPKPDRKDKETQRKDDIAAKAAGLGNRRNYRKAEAVVNHGSQPLKDAMNRKKVSIDAAYQLSKLPEEELASMDFDDKQAVKEKVRQIRKPPEKPCTNPDIDRVLELTDGWPEDQVLTLIEVLKMKIKGHSHDCH